MSYIRHKLPHGAAFSLYYHLVWCPKYRRPVLVDGVDDYLKELIQEKAKEIDISIEAMEVMPDHVHLFVSADPTKSVHYIIQQLKGYTSNKISKKFPHIKKRLPTLWNRAYYAGTVGAATESVIRAYIESQKGK